MVGTALILAWALMGALSASANPDPIVVEITGIGFGPSALTIGPDTTVTWVNKGSDAHRIVSEPGGALDSPVLEPRFSYSYTFHSTGTFEYYDPLHPDLIGRIVVADGVPADPEPAPAPQPPAVPSPAAAPTPAPTPSPAPPSESQGAPGASGAASSGADSRGAGSEFPSAKPAIKAGDGVRSEPLPRTDSPSFTASIEAGNEWFGNADFQGATYATTVEQGDTVEWKVLEGFHNVYECGESWAGQADGCAAAVWNSDAVVTAGGTYSRAFDVSGIYYYMCTIHPVTMRGVIHVESEDGSSATPTPTPSPVPTQISGPSDVTPTPAVAGLAGVPSGGGPPFAEGGLPTTLLLLGAAAAFVISGLAFVGGGVRI
jgi:plastocyanin